MLTTVRGFYLFFLWASKMACRWSFDTLVLRPWAVQGGLLKRNQFKTKLQQLIEKVLIAAMWKVTRESGANLKRIKEREKEYYFSLYLKYDWNRWLHAFPKFTSDSLDKREPSSITSGTVELWNCGTSHCLLSPTPSCRLSLAPNLSKQLRPTPTMRTLCKKDWITRFEFDTHFVSRYLDIQSTVVGGTGRTFPDVVMNHNGQAWSDFLPYL